jgi:hypothetical protein
LPWGLGLVWLRAAKGRDGAGGAPAGEDVCQVKLTTPGADEVGSNYILWAVVAAFDQELGAQNLDQIGWRILVEDHNQVDRSQCRQDNGASLFILDRAARAFKPLNRFIAIQADD